MRSEKEKMLAGEIYDCADTELIDRWHEAKRLQRLYAEADTRDAAKLDSILDELLGSRGEECHIAAPIYVDYGENIHLGRNVEINMGCTLLDCNRITIGDYTGIGPGVHIYTVFHPTIPSERMPQGSSYWHSQTAPVTIGRNVWIGGGSIVLPGVTIGDGSTIGAGSVVTRDIPPHCIAVGNPCRVIKYLDKE